jgi:serine/threonine-protein phosphatase with EF-hand domain
MADENVTMEDIDRIPRWDYNHYSARQMAGGVPAASGGGVSLHSEAQPPPHEDMRDFELMKHLLWSDPVPVCGKYMSKRGAGVMFGPDICKTFLERNKFVALIRSHQCVKIGYEWPFGNKNMLATVFSASNYCGSGNQGAYMNLDPEMNFRFHGFSLSNKNSSQSLRQSNRLHIVELVLRHKEDLRTAFKEELVKFPLDIKWPKFPEPEYPNTLISVESWSKVMLHVLELEVQWSSLVGLLVERANLYENKKYVDYAGFLKQQRGVVQPASTTNALSSSSRDSIDSTEQCALDALYSHRNHLEVVFRYFDSDGDGVVTREEFAKGCNELNEKLEPGRKIQVTCLFQWKMISSLTFVPGIYLLCVCVCVLYFAEFHAPHGDD